jgi:hypothetical protein
VVFVFIAVSVAIILLEAPGLVKKKMWRELAAFLAYFFLGMALIIPQLLGVKLPNPTKAIEALFKPFAEMLK